MISDFDCDLGNNAQRRLDGKTVRNLQSTLVRPVALNLHQIM